MARPPYIPLPKAKTPAQQEADFTAEGSPPPGKVANEVPATAGKGSKGMAHRPPAKAR